MNDLGLIWAMLGGEIKHNQGDTTLLSNTQATRTITVPTGVRWYLFGGVVLNDDSVARTIKVQVLDESNNVIFYYASASTNAAGWCAYPQSQASKVNGQTFCLPMKAGWDILITWEAGGASAGGTAESSAIVLEVPA